MILLGRLEDYAKEGLDKLREIINLLREIKHILKKERGK